MKLLLLSLMTVSYAFAHGIDPKVQAKCQTEVSALKCKTDDRVIFMKCIDSKITKLSRPCQEMHEHFKDDEAKEGAPVKK